MADIKIGDASAAETVVRRALEAQYGDRLKGLSFRKCWLSAASDQKFWEVEGTFTRKKGMLGKEARNFKYQIHPGNGSIMGYEEVTPK